MNNADFQTAMSENTIYSSGFLGEDPNTANTVHDMKQQDTRMEIENHQEKEKLEQSESLSNGPLPSTDPLKLQKIETECQILLTRIEGKLCETQRWEEFKPELQRILDSIIEKQNHPIPKEPEVSKTNKDLDLTISSDYSIIQKESNTFKVEDDSQLGKPSIEAQELEKREAISSVKTWMQMLMGLPAEYFKIIQQAKDGQEASSKLIEHCESNPTEQNLLFRDLNKDAPRVNQNRQVENSSVIGRNPQYNPLTCYQGQGQGNYSPSNMSFEHRQMNRKGQVNGYQIQVKQNESFSIWNESYNGLKSTWNSFVNLVSSPSFSFGLKNYGNTCFMNALFQCLYQVKPFREEMIKIGKVDRFPSVCPPRNMGELLGGLFQQMKSRNEGKDSSLLDEMLERLVQEIYDTRKEFKKRKPGDSSTLFRAILEVLTRYSSLENHPQTKMFACGPLKKMLKCLSCKIEKEISVNMQILEVRDICFLKNNDLRFFQHTQEKRTCSCTQSQNQFSCTYTATSLPEILVIRVQDTIHSTTDVKIIPELGLEKQSEGDGKPQETVKYEFVSAVLNTSKGEIGYHSVALSRENGLYYIYDDDKMGYECSLESLNWHPKLLFYKRSMGKQETQVNELD